MKEGFAGLRGVALVVCASLVAGCVAPAISATSGLNGIEHILVIYAENRSFDHLYGLFPGEAARLPEAAGRPLPRMVGGERPVSARRRPQ